VKGISIASNAEKISARCIPRFARNAAFLFALNAGLITTITIPIMKSERQMPEASAHFRIGRIAI